MLDIVKSESGERKVRAESIRVGQWFLCGTTPRMRVEWRSGHTPTYADPQGKAVDNSRRIVSVDGSGIIRFTKGDDLVTPIRFVNQLEYVIDD